MKNTKKTVALSLSLLMAVSVTACSGKKIEEGNDKRPSIYISVFNGGYGREWLDTIVADYNAARPDNSYKISVRASKDEYTTILAGLQAGSAIYDMFITAEAYKFIDAGVVEPITDVWDSKPEGSDRTIRQMMIAEEDYSQGYGDGSGAEFALPLVESIRGFVYDHELFLKYGLLYNETGAFITSPTETLSKGKDGIAGTYDDGHPETEEQWEALVSSITQKLGYAFNYTGKFGAYVNDIFDMLYAQMDGVDKYMLNYTYDGTYDFGDGNGETRISIENGYRLAEMKGVQFALEWMDKYLACKDTTLGIKNPYTYASSGTTSYSHEDAQTDFVTFTAKNKQKKIGMLVEGDWWENESKELFNELDNSSYTDYAFRTHDYRFMTLPRFDGQKESGNVYTIADNMFLALKKQTDDEKKAICKDFMTFFYQPKYIQNFTVVSGGVMPYDVELTDAQKESLSPFVQKYLQLYNDRANNKFINPILSRSQYYALRSGMPRPGSGANYWIVINGLYYMSASDYRTKMINGRKENWATTLKNYTDYMAARG